MNRRAPLIALGGLGAVLALVVGLVMALNGGGSGSGPVLVQSSPTPSTSSSDPSATDDPSATSDPSASSDPSATSDPGATSEPPAPTTPTTSGPPVVQGPGGPRPAGLTITTRTAPTSRTATTTTTRLPTTSTSTRPTTSTSTRATKPPTTAPATSGDGQIRSGTTHQGRATFYAADGGGNCSYEPGGDLMVTAMNRTDYDGSAVCGAYLRVQGPSGTVTVKVVDQCPECPPGALDLSREAFAKIATPSLGQVTVTWTVLSPALSGPISIKYKDGSSQYWCGIQIRNHRNPIRSVEAKVGGAWKALPRKDYNYFLSESGAGCGGALRVTDSYGAAITTDALPVRPGVVQQGPAQFPAPA